SSVHPSGALKVSVTWVASFRRVAAARPLGSTSFEARRPGGSSRAVRHSRSNAPNPTARRGRAAFSVQMLPKRHSAPVRSPRVLAAPAVVAPCLRRGGAGPGGERWGGARIHAAPGSPATGEDLDWSGSLRHRVAITRKDGGR